MISTDDIGRILAGGGDVIDRDGDKIGSIQQIFVEDRTGQPAWVTVKTGLFGMSESFVPLAGATTSGNDIRVNYDKATVKDAPRIDDDNGTLSVDQEDTLYRYYDIAWDDDTNVGTGTTDTDRLGTDRVGTDRVGTDRADTDRVGTDRVGTDTDDTSDTITRSEERLHVGKEREQTGKVRLRKYVVTEPVTKTVPVSHEEVRIEREPITDADATTGADLTDDEADVTLHAERPVVEKETVPVERVRLDKDTVTEDVPVEADVRKEEIEVDSDGKGRTGSI
jgi:uncharacterized protein (TIGR02271 family)